MNFNQIIKNHQNDSMKIFFCMLIICIIGFSIRWYYFEPGLPITFDGINYFLYALEVSKSGSLPYNFSPDNNGWPILLSVFFSMFNDLSIIELMQVQKVVSMTISVLTAIPVYFLCRKFFGSDLSILGVAIFIFEPRIIQNSLFGITESLYILLFTITLIFFLSSNKLIYVSFAILGFLTIVRSEGIFLFIAISILLVLKYKHEKFRIIPKYLIALTIFALILLPMMEYKTEIHGEDRITSRVYAGLENHNKDSFARISDGLSNFVKFLGWNLIPIFIFTVPIGIFLFLRHFNFKKFVLIFSLCIMSLPSIYAYSIPALDSRFLYFMYPIFCVISLFVLKKFIEKVTNTKFISLIIILGIIIASIFFLELKGNNQEYENDVFLFNLLISEKISGINSFLPEEQYLSSAYLIKNWPEISIVDRYGNPKIDFMIFETDNYQNLNEFILKNKDNGLSHIVIDNNQNRPDFLKIKPEKYSYLKSEQINQNLAGKYSGEIYRIDYDEFFRLLEK